MVHLMIIITGITFLGTPRPPSTPLIHVVLLNSAVQIDTHPRCAATVSDTIKYHKVPLPEAATPGQKIGILASRWRAERNFWIAFISLFTWGYAATS
jgi:hypothetical protein